MERRANGCRRCGGMMIATYADLLSPGETGEAVIGRRCANCGDYEDQQVLLNRSGHVSRKDIQHRSIPQRARPIQTRGAVAR